MSDTSIQQPAASREFRSFAEFYPFYLSEHSNDVSRRLHYVGSLLVLTILAWALISANFWLLLALPVAGYGFAWVRSEERRVGKEWRCRWARCHDKRELLSA